MSTAGTWPPEPTTLGSGQVPSRPRVRCCSCADGSAERFSLREDGKVVYRLRRPWPNERGATHLILEPLDFLRRLAALVSFPYAHQTRYHGIFAARSRMRRLLSPPPERHEVFAIEATEPTLPLLDTGKMTDAQTNKDDPSSAHRSRTPWAQLLRRVLHVEALSCPKCSTHLRAVPMAVLAFLSDRAVVEKILRHLGLPHAAPALAPARSTPWQTSFDPLPPPLQTDDIGASAVEEDASAALPHEAYNGPAEPSSRIRPPP